MKKKILTAIFAAFTATVCVYGFTACNVTPGSTTPPPSGSEEEESKEEEKPSKPALTFDGFIKDHKTDAVKFFEDYIYNSVVGEREVKAENWYLNDADGDDKVESAAMLYTYKVSKAERTVEVATVTFNPVSVQDIVDGKVDSVNATVSRETVFTFDAKANYDSQDILNALYNTVRDTTSTIKVYNEVESLNAKYRNFNIVRASNDKIQIDNIVVDTGNGTIEDLIYSIGDSDYRTVETKSTVNIDGTNIYTTSYTLESIDEIEKPDPEKPEEPVTNAEIIQALNDNCKEDLVNRCLLGFTGVSLDKVSNGTWRAIKDANGNITSAEYAFNYADANNSHYYTVGKVVFDSPVSVKDLQDGKLGDVTYSRAYRTNYNPTIQSAREDLTTVICETVFGINNTATRIIVDDGFATTPELGQIGRFKVIEITDSGVKEASIDIKLSSTDDDYIEMLEDESNYNITDANSYEFVGSKL